MMASLDMHLQTPPVNVFALMEVRTQVVIDTVSYASCAAIWRDILPLFPLKGNLHTSIGNFGRRSTRRGSVAQLSPRLSG
jgi:hypothetical protein